MLFLQETMTSTLDVARTYAEIIALVSAAGFFIYKAFSGYMIVNVSVAARADREVANETEDNLAVAVTLKKGSNGSLELHDIRARVSLDDNQTKDIPIVGTERLRFTAARERNARMLLKFGTISTSNPFMRLAHEEEATFSGTVRVPSKAVCIVEVAVIGKRTASGRVGQWRTSVVSLPKG